MKISRKMQMQVELKIRHAMATGHLPMVRSSGPGHQPRQEQIKAESDASNHSK